MDLVSADYAPGALLATYLHYALDTTIDGKVVVRPSSGLLSVSLDGFLLVLLLSSLQFFGHAFNGDLKSLHVALLTLNHFLSFLITWETLEIPDLLEAEFQID